MSYIYFLVTPSPHDIADCPHYFCKFGLTQNANDHEIRSGYTTHNPSIDFTKRGFNANVAGVQWGNVILTADLPKDCLRLMCQHTFTQVGNTEWMWDLADNVLAVTSWFGDAGVRPNVWRDQSIDRDSVQTFMTQLENKIRRGVNDPMEQ